MKRIDKALKFYKASRGESAEKNADAPSIETEKVEKKIHGLIRESGTGGGASRAAKFLMLLGKSDAAEILKHMSDEEVEVLTREISDTKRIGKQEAGEILGDFHVKKAKGGTSRKGTDVARRMLENAFGKEKGSQIYRKAVPFEIDNPFSFLEDFEFPQILMLLKRESDSVISVILPYMDSRKASMILEALHPKLQMKVVGRIARMEKVSPDALLKVAEALREKIRKQGRLVTEEIDGPKVLAEILASMSGASEREILANIDSYHPEICEEIRELLFTVEIIFQMDDQDFQMVLRDFSEEEIAVLMKGKEEPIRARFLESISERRRQIVNEEMIRLGPMKRSEVDKATREFIEYIRELADEGKVLLQRDREHLEEV
ncbi:MAG: flagellar motor switch protein FliG [Spirochaetales bacterium]|jgi:flagellar motor switch protein FliG|nr:flagellar motor switch protein FliG [Spirochaetales bacterium]